MATRTKKFQIQFRVTEEVKIAMEKAAADDARTVTSLAERLVLDHLRKNGYLPGGRTPPRRKTGDT